MEDAPHFGAAIEHAMGVQDEDALAFRPLHALWEWRPGAAQCARRAGTHTRPRCCHIQRASLARVRREPTMRTKFDLESARHGVDSVRC